MERHVSDTVHFESARFAQQLFNNESRNLAALQSELGVSATVRDGWIKLEGPPDSVQHARELFLVLSDSLKSGGAVRNRTPSAQILEIKRSPVACRVMAAFWPLA